MPKCSNPKCVHPAGPGADLPPDAFYPDRRRCILCVLAVHRARYAKRRGGVRLRMPGTYYDRHRAERRSYYLKHRARILARMRMYHERKKRDDDVVKE